MSNWTTYVAPRTCPVAIEGEATRDERKSAGPLCSYTNAAAYVLIAEPGVGKTHRSILMGLTSVFGLSAPSISRRIRTAAASLASGFPGHSGRIR